MEQSNDNKQKQQQQPPRPRRPRMRLPFDNRRENPVGWIYDNRVGLCVTIIVYLLFAIIFVSAKIGNSKRAVNETMYIDLGEVELVSEELERLKEEVRKKSEVDWKSIRNLSSNENALNENLEDEKGTDVSELNAAAEAIEKERKANQEAYERGLREANAIGENRKSGEGDKERIIPLQGEIGDRIKAYKIVLEKMGFATSPEARLIVSNIGNPLSRSTIQQVVKAKLSEANVQGKKSPHVLRHTFATVMLNNEAGLEAVKELMGHESVSTTQIYTHTTFEELKKAYKQAHPRASINP